MLDFKNNPTDKIFMLLKIEINSLTFKQERKKDTGKNSEIN